jgi:glucose-1-phosphate cytidylyltransferase
VFDGAHEISRRPILKVILFCGGLGLRMRDGSTTALKPMVTVGDRPLLWHIMRYFAHFGATDFILCLGHGAEAVEKYFARYGENLAGDFRLDADGTMRMLTQSEPGWSITFVDTGLDSSIGERLARVRSYVEDEEMFLVNYSDTLTDVHLPDVVERFRRSTAVASLLAVPLTSTHHVVDVADDGTVRGFRSVRELNQWENGGYFVMRPAVFEHLRTGQDLVPHALDRVAATGGLLAYPYSGFWRAVDTHKDRLELEQMYRDQNCPWMVWDEAHAKDETRSLSVDDVPAVNSR